MAVDWDTHLLAPLHGVFGELVNYRPQIVGGDAYDIVGIFDRAYTRDVETLEGDIATNTTKPVLGVRDAQFKSPPRQYDQLFVRGRLYVVIDVQPDGHGGTRLELNQVKA